MEPIDVNEQGPAPQIDDDSSKGLDFELWRVTQVVTSARLRLVQFQAALGETQLQCRRLARERDDLQTLYDAKSDSLLQAWGEYNIINETLQEETSKSQQLSELVAQTKRDLDAEVSHRETIETCLIQQDNVIADYRQSLGEKDQAIKRLEEDCARYLVVITDLTEQLEEQRGITERRHWLEESATASGVEDTASTPSQPVRGGATVRIDEHVASVSPVAEKRPNRKRKVKA
ncbi:hypothetical protein NKR23_g11796 [Pleurostoma richardsiae]|uniref:Uncharacterized protein n=1 Tax=Pleurostoma richardsiae TaxID=41990 RepID=A0AA38VGE7_9PEZI|nr:hypothetical protein NKR23_g11796 [Pleurostoma richardsiae]